MNATALVRREVVTPRECLFATIVRALRMSAIPPGSARFEIENDFNFYFHKKQQKKKKKMTARAGRNCKQSGMYLHTWNGFSPVWMR